MLCLSSMRIMAEKKVTPLGRSSTYRYEKRTSVKLGEHEPSHERQSRFGRFFRNVRHASLSVRIPDNKNEKGLLLVRTSK